MQHHDVFISYSSKNKAVADALVHFLEDSRIRCWIAPRDIPGGAEYAEVIDKAIREASVFVMLFSDASQQSPWCKKEANLAVASCKFILPVKIEDVALEGSMRLYLNDKHWVDAIPDPNAHFSMIRNSILRILSSDIECEEKCPQVPSVQRRFLTRLRIVLGGCFVWLGSVLSLATVVVFSTSKGNKDGMVWSAFCYSLLPLVGAFLLRRRVFLRFSKDSLTSLYPLRLLRSFCRVFLGAWIFLMGVLLFLVFPIFLYQILEKTGSVSADVLLYSLSVSIFMGGVGLAVFKAGLAILESNWVKFNFTRQRFFKWFLIVSIPGIVGMVGAMYFQSKCGELRPTLSGVVKER